MGWGTGFTRGVGVGVADTSELAASFEAAIRVPETANPVNANKAKIISLAVNFITQILAEK